MFSKPRRQRKFLVDSPLSLACRGILTLSDWCLGALPETPPWCGQELFVWLCHVTTRQLTEDSDLFHVSTVRSGGGGLSDQVEDHLIWRHFEVVNYGPYCTSLYEVDVVGAADETLMLSLFFLFFSV